MEIGLLDIDSHNFPNLPLMKLSAYHKQRGDTVNFATPLERFDILYMSKIFTFTPDDLYYYNADKIIKGGTGCGLNNNLPHEIEHIYPDYSLYPQYCQTKGGTAYGFLTRGCFRNCPFCIVSEKEGMPKQTAELGEFWRGQKHIKLLDPNLLACNARDKILQSLIDSRAWVDFTQGLDVRLTDKYIAKMLTDIKIECLHFAWDNPNDDLSGQFELIKKVTGLNCRKLVAYVLINYNSTHEQDLERIYKLRKIGVDPFVMIYDKDNAPREAKRIQRWVNNRRIWRVCERFEDFI
jgi:hypothetical protein